MSGPKEDLSPLRLNARLLGLTLGFFGGFLLMSATLWLVVKGGERVGPHLALLGTYLPGYSVTLRGSLIGFTYAFCIGSGLGWLMGTIYNRLAMR